MELRRLGSDALAGLTVALLLVPQAMAYAALAGLPPHYGLFAAGLPCILAGLATGSPYLQTGPTALTSLLTLGALTSMATPESADYIALAALLALVVGALRLIAGLVRVGWITRVMTPAVVKGFAFAAGLLILSSQVPAVLGTVQKGTGVLQRAISSLTSPDQWEASALVLAVGTGLCIYGGRRIHPTFPGVLVAAILGTLFSKVTDYPSLLTVGEVPEAIFRIRLDLPWEAAPSLLVVGGVIALVGFAEVVVISETLGPPSASNKKEEGHTWSPNREFISQGIANISAALVSSFPVGASFSRSNLCRLAGALSPNAGVIAGLVVLLFLPFADLLEALPTAVLGAIVIATITSLLNPRPVFELWRVQRSEGAVALTTFVLTLASAPHIEYGVILGVVLAGFVRLRVRTRGEPPEKDPV